MKFDLLGIAFASILALGCLALKDLGAPGFSCPDMTPSAAVPTSVHALKPSDIKIVAALGDSLTAANGAGTDTFLLCTPLIENVFSFFCVHAKLMQQKLLTFF